MGVKRPKPSGEKYSNCSANSTIIVKGFFFYKFCFESCSFSIKGHPWDGWVVGLKWFSRKLLKTIFPKTKASFPSKFIRWQRQPTVQKYI